MIAWTKGVRSAGVREVMIGPSMTTASSTNVAPALTVREHTGERQRGGACQKKRESGVRGGEAAAH